VLQWPVQSKSVTKGGGITNRSSYRYVGRNEFDDEKYQREATLSNQYPYWGVRKIYELLPGEEPAISCERARLISRREEL
jgi:hypothetical protein